MSQQFPIPRTTRGPIVLIASAGQTAFTFPFWVTDGRDIEVRVKIAGGLIFGAPLTFGSQYSVTNLNQNGGATVILPPQVAGNAVRLRGKRVPTRTTSVVQGGTVRSLQLEQELDLINTTQQELRRDADDDRADIEAMQPVLADVDIRAVRVPAGETGVSLPSAAERRDRLAGYSPSGNPVAVSPPAVVVTTGAADFSSRVAAVGAGLPVGQQHFRTAGYYGPDDAGGAEYHTQPTEPAHVAGKIPLASGWGVISGPGLSLPALGVSPANSDNRVDMQNAFDLAVLRGIQSVSGEGDMPVSMPLSNDYGVVVKGGKVLGLQPGKQPRQLNSYTDDMSFVYNAVYMDRAMTRIGLGPGGGFSKLTWDMRGDSQIEGYVAPPAVMNGYFLPQLLLPRLFAHAGYPNVEVFNNALSGTNWSQLNVASVISNACDILFLKYEVNDGAISVFPKATRLTTLKTQVHAKLAAIRAALPRAFQTIIIMGPIPTNDDVEGRNEEWYEQVRNVLREACDKFECVYLDAYGYLRKCRGLAGIAYDADENGQAIHPLPMTLARLWGWVFDSLFSPATLAYWRTNAYTHTGLVVEAANVNQFPGEFDFGRHIKTCRAADGWPADGQVETVRSIDSLTYQQLDAVGGRTYKRHTPNGINWTLWDGVVYSPTLVNGWANVGGGGACSFSRTLDGHVTVVINASGGGVTTGTALFVLPERFRPASFIFMPARTGPAALNPCTLNIQQTGHVVCWDACEATGLHGAITFPAA